MNPIKYLREKGLKHTISIVYRYKLQFLIEKIMLVLTKHGSLKDVIILESHNDFDSNGGAFYEYLIKYGYNKKYKIVWFLRNNYTYELPLNVEGYSYQKPSIRRAYYHCVAKYIICGHWVFPSIREGQKSYYTTHGGFSLKAFKGNVILPKSISYILTPSKYLEPVLADGYMIEYPNDKMISIGFPLHDVLYNTEPGDLKKLTSEKYKKILLWMPTFRKNVDGREDSSRVQTLGIPIINSYEEYNRLNLTLAKEEVLLIIKIHPMQDMKDIKVSSLSNICLLDGNTVKKLRIDNYRLMKDADALISDYSSAAYDFLHLNRPIAYTMDDAEDYKGFLVDNPKDFMAGEIIYTYEDFCVFITNVINNVDEYKEKRRELFDKIWEFHDGKSCERLAKHMGIYDYERIEK